MTSPSATVSEYSSLGDLAGRAPGPRARPSASSASLPTQSLSLTGFGPLLTTRSTGGVRAQRRAGLGVAADDDALRRRCRTTSRWCVPKARWSPASASCASSSVMPRELGYVVALLAEREHDRDGAAVEHLRARLGVGADRPGRPGRSRSRPCRPTSASSPASSSSASAADSASCPSTPGVRGVAAVEEPPGARRRRRRRAAARRAAATSPRRRRAAAGGGGGVASAVRRRGGGRRRSGGSEDADRSPSSRRALGRRTGPARCRRRRRLDGLGVHPQRRQVGGQVRVVEHALGERVADPVHLVQQHGGVGRAQARGRGPSRGRPARRRTPGCRARAATAAARPRGRACRRPGSGDSPSCGLAPVSSS